MDNKELPVQIRKVQRVGAGRSCNVTLPITWLDMWEKRLGRPVDQVEIYDEGENLTLVPRGIRVDRFATDQAF